MAKFEEESYDEDSYEENSSDEEVKLFFYKKKKSKINLYLYANSVARSL
jgi:hypothetical protein